MDSNQTLSSFASSETWNSNHSLKIAKLKLTLANNSIVMTFVFWFHVHFFLFFFQIKLARIWKDTMRACSTKQPISWQQNHINLIYFLLTLVRRTLFNGGWFVCMCGLFLIFYTNLSVSMKENRFRGLLQTRIRDRANKMT